MISFQACGLPFPPKSILDIARADNNGQCDGPRFLGEGGGLFWRFRDGVWTSVELIVGADPKH